MSYLELKSFAEFDPSELGGALSAIATNPANDVLRRDFPTILRFYGNPVTARETVKARQTSIASEPYEALAVVVGHSASDARVVGVTTFTMMETPGRRGVGPNAAIWLDQTREPEFRRIGVELMPLRMQRLIGDTRFTGRLWTVIRPDNTASTTVWRHPYNADWELCPVDTPKRYPGVDGVWKKRQLFVCRQALEELR